MIMKVAVPLPKHSPMFGHEGFFADRVQLVLAQDLLDLVEARGRRAGLDADPVGLLQRLGRTTLMGMRAVLACDFCFALAS
jgi:hypothetical protein